MRALWVLAVTLLCGCYESTPFSLFHDTYPDGPWPAARSGPWEGYGPGEIDLEGHAIRFAPRLEGVVTYEWAVVDIGDRFTVTPGSGQTSVRLPLGDDDTAEYVLERMGSIRFYGERYDRVWVGSNGYVTFGVADASLSPAVENHFASPAVSLLRGDLDPRAGGSVYVDEWPTRLVISYVGVPQFGGDDTVHDVQAILDESGEIELCYVTLETRRSWLVGLSNGLPGETPPEVDFVGGAGAREDCCNGDDDDGDGLFDCDDPDCATDTRCCTPFHESDCFDGMDNDGDGLADCADGDCAAQCPDQWERDCFDGRDNDFDGLVDCADDDCLEVCWRSEWDCENGWDDDGDGLVDCEDPECFDEEICLFSEHDCGDGWDDDGDGRVDCADGDCWRDPLCRDTTCRGVWERFVSDEEEDLVGWDVLYLPVADGYVVEAAPGDEGWPRQPLSGDVRTRLPLGDDETSGYVLRVLPAISFFGVLWDRLWVNSNGYVSFGRGSSSLSSDVAEHFRLPSVAALRGDLDPRAAGEVIVDEFEDAVVVTWDEVPWYSDMRPNSFQITLFEAGVVEVYYREIATGRGNYLAGVSNGCEGWSYPEESDLVPGGNSPPGP